MELRQLEYFVAVAEENHFTRAAQRMHIGQSGLSAAIQSLEQELGVNLFVRTTRNVELTEVGRAFFEETQRVLTAVRSAKETITAMQGLENGRVALGTMPTLPPVLNLPKVLGAFHTVYPGIDIHLCQNKSEVLIEEVRYGDLDVALVALVGNKPKGLCVTELVSEPMVMICDPNHPLATRQEIDLIELADQSTVDLKPAWATRQMVDQAFNKANIERHIRVIVNDTHALLELVANRLGIAIVPQSLAERGKGIATIPLVNAPIWTLALVTLRTEITNPAARAFLAVLANEMPEINIPACYLSTECHQS